MDIEKSPLLVEVLDGEGGMSVGRVKSRGRGRALARGAATLIDKWPDNLSRCWLTTLMFSLSLVGMCLVINALTQHPLDLRIVENITPLAIMLDKDTTKITQPLTHSSMVRRESKIYQEEISCHLFINAEDIFPINKYLKYISLLASIYPTHRFDVYLLTNDAVKYAYDYKALLSSWELITNDINDRSKKKYDFKLNEAIRSFSPKHDNVAFVQMKLSEYFEETPLKRLWHTVPASILPFLTRAVSVWEKGGISLDLEASIGDQSSNQKKEKMFELLDSYFEAQAFERSKKQGQESIDTALMKRLLMSSRGRKHRISKRASPVIFFQERLLYKVPIQSEYMVFYIVSNTSNIFGNTLSSSPISSGSRLTISSSVNKINKKTQWPRLAHSYDKYSEFPFLNRNLPYSYHVKKRDLISTSTEREDETVLTLSRKGDVIATKAHCHAFLAQIFKCLQGKTVPQSSEELIDQALSIFCNLDSSSHFEKCPGVRILA